MSMDGSLASRIANIWAETLEWQHVAADDNFFEDLGGQSFLAVVTIERMRRELSLEIGVEDLLECPTVQKLCERVLGDGRSTIQSSASASSLSDVVGDTHSLLPAQYWYVKELRPYEARFSVQAAIASAVPVDGNALRESVSAVLDWHPGLTAALSGPAGLWRLTHTSIAAEDVVSEPDPLVVFQYGVQLGLDQLTRTMRGQLSPAEGRVIQVAHLRATDVAPDLIVVVVHHVACDGLALQVLLSDLERSYKSRLNGAMSGNSPSKPTSLWWANRLGQYMRSPESERERKHWADVPRSDPSPLAQDQPSEDAGLNRITHRRLSSAANARLHESARRQGVSVNELVIACVGTAHRRVTGERRILISNARHGRDIYFDGLSCAASVGWFSYNVPHLLEVEHLSPTESVPSLAEQLRSVPNRGVGNLSLAHSDSQSPEAVRCREMWQNVSVMVNSRIDLLPKRDDSGWKLFVHQPDPGGIWPRERRARVVLDSYEGELHFRWNYHEGLVRADVAGQLVDVFFSELERFFDNG